MDKIPALPWPYILPAVGAFVLGFGTKAAANWLHNRGKTDLDLAQEKLERAMKTKDTHDDDEAREAVIQARKLKATLDAFADALEQRPPSVGK